MNLLYLSYRDINPPHSGRPTFDIIKNLSNKGTNITILEGIPRMGKHNILNVSSKNNITVIKGNRISTKDINRLNLQLKGGISKRIFDILMHLSIKPDVIYVDNLSELNISLKIGELFKIPVLFRWYGIFDLPESLKFANIFKTPKFCLKFIRSKIIIKMITNLLNYKYNSKLIITDDGARVSEFINYICKLCGSGCGKKIITVKNSLPNHKLTNFYYAKDDTINLLYISRLVGLKKSLTIIHMLYYIKKYFGNLFNRIKAYIIGNGYLKKKMESLAEKMEITKSVYFLGYLNREKVTEIVEYATLSVCINSHNPAVESLFSGIPIIINDFGEVNRIFKNVKGVFYVNTNNSWHFSEKKAGRAFAFKFLNFINYLNKIDNYNSWSSNIIESVSKEFPDRETKIQKEISFITDLVKVSS